MKFFGAGLMAGIVGKLGELKTPKESGSPEFKLRQAIREYNALLDRTDPTAPAGAPSIKCLSSEKATRRRNRHELIRKAQNNLARERDPTKRKRLMETTDRLAKDMDRVEDAKLSLHVYTANEDPARQQDFLKPLRDQPPPGFKNVSLAKFAEDLSVEVVELKELLNSETAPSQRIMIYERDTEILGPGPKYTIAFRGSTLDPRDWNNNGRNEAGFEAPHQKNAARLGEVLKRGCKMQGKTVDSLISATGHSKGGSEGQAFAAASGCSARVFNPAGFSPSQYQETAGVSVDMMHIDRTTVIEHDGNGCLLQSTKLSAHTDPLYYAQNTGFTRFIMKKPITSGPPRELAPIDPDRSVPCNEQSDSEAHSMLQVVEALERDKAADMDILQAYVLP